MNVFFIDVLYASILLVVTDSVLTPCTHMYHYEVTVKFVLRFNVYIFLIWFKVFN